MASWLVEWKNATETQWLKDSPSQPLQQSLKDLERAYKNFFQNRAAFPHSKSGDRMMYSATRRALSSIRKTAVFLPKLGWMRYRNSRQVTGVVKMSLSASPAVSGTSVFRQKVKYQLRFTLQHQWSGRMLAWLNSPRCQMAQSLSL